MMEWLNNNWWWFFPTYMVVCFGFSVLVGKSIAYGMGTDLERQDGDSQ